MITTDEYNNIVGVKSDKVNDIPLHMSKIVAIYNIFFGFLYIPTG